MVISVFWSKDMFCSFSLFHHQTWIVKSAFRLKGKQWHLLIFVSRIENGETFLSFQRANVALVKKKNRLISICRQNKMTCLLVVNAVHHIVLDRRWQEGLRYSLFTVATFAFSLFLCVHLAFVRSPAFLLCVYSAKSAIRYHLYSCQAHLPTAVCHGLSFSSEQYIWIDIADIFVCLNLSTSSTMYSFMVLLQSLYKSF